MLYKPIKNDVGEVVVAKTAYFSSNCYPIETVVMPTKPRSPDDSKCIKQYTFVQWYVL